MPERPSIDSRQPRELPVAFVRYSGGEPVESGEWAPLIAGSKIDYYRNHPLWDVVRVVPVGAEDGRTAELEEAIEEAMYALDPNQGERPDPVRAGMWLRTTLRRDHPNYVTPDAARAARKGQGRTDG